MSRLIHSSKFWVFVIAQLVSALTLFGVSALHFSPTLVAFLISFVEGLGGLLIWAIAQEDLAAKSNYYISKHIDEITDPVAEEGPGEK